MLNMEPMVEIPEAEKAPSPTRVSLLKDGRVAVARAGALVPARAVRCFPWSEAARFVSLRDDEGNELALIDDPRELDLESRGALEIALAEAGFVLEIEAIAEVEEEFELRSWRVRTRSGPRRFQTKLDEWPRTVPGGGLLIRDVAGDLYLVRHPGALDDASRKILWAFVD